MGKSGNNKPDKDSFMLKKEYCLIFLFVFFCVLVMSQRIVEDFSLELDEIIKKRSEKIESMFYDLGVKVYDDQQKIMIKSNDSLISEFHFQPNEKPTVDSVVSFFLNLEDSLTLMQNVLDNKGELIATKIEVIKALYEYPFIDKTGRYFVYISDKGTGNRNPFIIDLLTGQQQEIVIPQTSEYFPIMIKESLFFLKGMGDFFSINQYDLNTGQFIQLISGDISCIRTCSEELYFSDKNIIFKMDLSGNILEKYEFEDTIQSFAPLEDSLIVSILQENQYDLFAYDIREKELQKIQETGYNEVDVNVWDERSVIFSSNQSGNFGLYRLVQDTGDSDFFSERIYSVDKGDLFYSFYSIRYKKIICSLYESYNEPKLLIISY